MREAVVVGRLTTGKTGGTGREPTNQTVAAGCAVDVDIVDRTVVSVPQVEGLVGLYAAVGS